MKMHTGIIALNTFRETIRNRILINILLFAIGLILLSLVIGDWTLGQQVKVIKDFGLAAMSIFGLLIAIFIGIRLMVQEMEQKTIYIIASKPIHRWEIVLGKYFGLGLTLLINVLLMSAALGMANYIMEGRVDFGLIPAIVLIYMEILIIVAFSMLFSSFTTPSLGAVGTLIVFVVGHLSNFLKDYVTLYPDKGVNWLLKLVYYTAPNLEKLNLKMAVVSGHEYPPDIVWKGLIYAVCYIAILLIITSSSFQRRDLK